MLKHAVIIILTRNYAVFHFCYEKNKFYFWFLVVKANNRGMLVLSVQFSLTHNGIFELKTPGQIKQTAQTFSLSHH